MVLVAEENKNGDNSMAPKVEKLKLEGKLLSNFDMMKSKLASVPFYSTGIENDSFFVGVIESRNIHKMPYLFYLMNFTASGLEVIYSIPPDTSESLRRASVLKNVASALSMISEDYTVNTSELMQYVDSTIDKLLSGISQSYSSLYNKYDAMLEEYRALKRLNIELSASNRNLTLQASQLENENKTLKDSLEKLQKYSDESLMSIIEDWIEVHNNTIDIDLVSKTYNITAPRVEQILDKMVSMGYLEVRG